MTTYEWQWVIFGIALILGLMPVITMRSNKVGCILGLVLMWSLTLVSMSSMTGFLKSIGLGV